jgi:N utilization substance protein A
MAALVAPGAPVSVLFDYGLGEALAEKLLEGGITTVEKLGSMTPEQLEEIPGIGPKMVERIQLAVNNYYGQFEEVAPPATGDDGGAAPAEDAAPDAEAALPETAEAAEPEAPGESAEEATPATDSGTIMDSSGEASGNGSETHEGPDSSSSEKH